MTSRWTARLATFGILLVVFVAGLAVGIAVDRQVAAAEAPPEALAVATSDGEEPRDRKDDEERRRNRPMMIERVGLSPEQKLQVDSIVAVMGGLMSDLQKDYRSRYWIMVDSSRDALKRTLTPEQAVAYDSLVARNDQRRRPDDVPLPKN